MLDTVKGFFHKHLAALQDETTSLNERYIITKGIKHFLSGLFRALVIIGICYTILAPVHFP